MARVSVDFKYHGTLDCLVCKTVHITKFDWLPHIACYYRSWCQKANNKTIFILKCRHCKDYMIVFWWRLTSGWHTPLPGPLLQPCCIHSHSMSSISKGLQRASPSGCRSIPQSIWWCSNFNLAENRTFALSSLYIEQKTSLNPLSNSNALPLFYLVA